MSGNPITTARIGQRVYDIRHWKLTVVVFFLYWVPLFVGRVLSGRNLRGGGRTTDATFFRGANSHPRGWWNNLPGVVRAAVRLAVVGGVVLWVVGYRPVVVTAGVLLLVVVGWRVVVAWLARLHEKRVLRPVWPAVAGIIGAPADERPSKWLDIPPAHTDPHNTAPDPAIAVMLRAADADDERRIAALVQLFEQRFSRRYVGSVDYAARVGMVSTRPAEPPVWPAVAAVVGVPATVMAHQWLVVDDDTTTPGAVMRVRLPDDVIDETDILSDLTKVAQQRFGGEWACVVKVAEWPLVDGMGPVRQVVVSRKKPPPAPPAFVDFLAEHPDYKGVVN